MYCWSRERLFVHYKCSSASESLVMTVLILMFAFMCVRMAIGVEPGVCVRMCVSGCERVRFLQHFDNRFAFRLRPVVPFSTLYKYYGDVLFSATLSGNAKLSESAESLYACRSVAPWLFRPMASESPLMR